jgi:outer membrane biosynthesis protein TonB
MLPGRLGLRFALEALFLVLLAIGAGLADLRPALIVLVMAVAWVLVAVAEFTAERISASPLSYLLPPRAERAEGDAEQAAWPMPEERTVVAPPEERAEPVPEPAAEEPAPEPASEPEPEPEPEVLAEEEHQPEEGGAEESSGETVAPPLGRRLRTLLRRRDRKEEEPAPAAPPRHVKLLPRRSAPQSSRAAQEVAELFGSADSGADAEEREERRG